MALGPGSFLETIIAFLLPYFMDASMNKHEARSEIVDTLASYDTRTRAEMLQAAHIIAFGMTTLDVLAEAKTAEMSQSMRLRYRGCANNLNRSTLQTEKALDERLARELPPDPAAMPEPIDDMRQAEIMAVTQQHKARIDAQRPAPTPPPARTSRQTRRRTRRGTPNSGPTQCRTRCSNPLVPNPPHSATMIAPGRTSLAQESCNKAQKQAFFSPHSQVEMV